MACSLEDSIPSCPDSCLRLRWPPSCARLDAVLAQDTAQLVIAQSQPFRCQLLLAPGLVERGQDAVSFDLVEVRAQGEASDGLESCLGRPGPSELGRQGESKGSNWRLPTASSPSSWR